MQITVTDCLLLLPHSVHFLVFTFVAQLNFICSLCILSPVRTQFGTGDVHKHTPIEYEFWENRRAGKALHYKGRKWILYTFIRSSAWNTIQQISTQFCISICEFRENTRREARTFHTVVREIIFKRETVRHFGSKEGPGKRKKRSVYCITVYIVI